MENKTPTRRAGGGGEALGDPDAALEYFSQFGMHGTSTDKVAERAGVSKTNLLYYFPSKEALYIAVLKEILDVWLAPLRAA